MARGDLLAQRPAALLVHVNQLRSQSAPLVPKTSRRKAQAEIQSVDPLLRLAARAGSPGTEPEGPLLRASLPTRRSTRELWLGRLRGRDLLGQAHMPQGKVRIHLLQVWISPPQALGIRGNRHTANPEFSPHVVEQL